MYYHYRNDNGHGVSLLLTGGWEDIAQPDGIFVNDIWGEGSYGDISVGSPADLFFNYHSKTNDDEIEFVGGGFADEGTSVWPARSSGIFEVHPRVDAVYFEFGSRHWRVLQRTHCSIHTGYMHMISCVYSTRVGSASFSKISNDYIWTIEFRPMMNKRLSFRILR